MNKQKKVAIVILITVFSISATIINRGLKVRDNVYVVSKSEKEETKNLKYDEQMDKDKILEKTANKNDINENKSKEIRIFISGEVKNPGVVTIENSKRLIDAIDLLGGFTEEADLNKINLAMTIEDEMHYIIPKIGEEINNNNENVTQNNTKSQEDNSKININIANVSDLDKLPGVGEATANKILNYREEKGQFKSIEEIKNVNGIGDKKYEDIKDMITIE
ncbi:MULTISPECIES: helix-hairpin-helix domain-containing protein [Romboutsia]|uniref:Competence protein ComEA n=1 Tax=Romboutsia hominis TaxID=1507512 RepID=A0A2P2BNX5_9FIRM|nr:MULTISPECIES: helix-hairpin-helix domain-containing protein [Romboutsia]MCH1959274.1 helix-hairpin-helix domain-containing protein [Romboutsia hominis]MCH1970173.1 helix-hairpin-helix domain-containing protein [Romboutsia hominis]MDB8790156.1 helix-hairpin-helix domain-containing protein [Romboutsia sp. 1001216sp1]MDB8800646.1 helix-hairpin-helix domain-containing protein [Romboutsia sp. 1001216sp1]MDB8804074.1 helix-hairpin-helix domain-containing protein [Romboutsia sp. 1001216sp1]